MSSPASWQRIVKTKALKVGWELTLACGHVVIAFGNPEHAGGYILCLYCRDEENKKK